MDYNFFEDLARICKILYENPNIKKFGLKRYYYTEAPVRPITPIFKIVRFAVMNGILMSKKSIYTLTRKGRKFASIDIVNNELSAAHKDFIVNQIYMTNKMLKNELNDFFNNFIYIDRIVQKKLEFDTLYFRREDIQDKILGQQIVLFNFLSIITNFTDGKIILTQYGLKIYNELNANIKGITAEQLYELNTQNALIGAKAEEYTLNFEKKRLAEENRRLDLSRLVERIGHINLTLGYDINSFDGIDRLELDFNRFIEVKSTCEDYINFYWSHNELMTAKNLGNRYWIYVLTNFDKEQPNLCALKMIQNPYKNIYLNRKYSKQNFIKYYIEEV